MTEKDLFIANYLEANLKDCKLPYGLKYFQLRDSLIEKAEKEYEQFKNKKKY